MAQDSYFKFPVIKEGIYKITASQAMALGANSVKELSIYGYGGMLPQLLDSSSLDLKEVPVKEINGDLYFFLSAAPTIELSEGMSNYQTHHYTDTLYYLVQTHRNHTSSIPQISNPIASDSTHGILYQAKTYKKEEYNLLSSGRNWYGERVFNGETIILNFPEIAIPGLPLYYHGKFMSQSLTESNFRITINHFLDETASLPSISSSRYAIKGREGSIAGFTEESLANTKIQVKFHFQTSDRNGSGYLDYFMLGLPFYSTHLPSGIFYNFANKPSVLKPTGPQFVWDVSNFFGVQDISSAGAILSDAQRIAVFMPEEAESISAWEQVDLSLRAAPNFPELVIITSPLLKSEAERLAIHKNRTGTSTEVVIVQEIYNSFGYGNPDVTAIRNFLAFHYHQGKQLKNVLIFGKGTFDYKGKLGGRPNLVPTYSSRSSLNPLTTYSSDDYYGFMNFGEGNWEETSEGDLDLGIGVGRLPVINLQEARNVVDKIIDYGSVDVNSGDWKRKILFVADDGDHNIHLNDSEKLAKHLSENHPEIILEKLYLDDFDQIITGLVQRSPSAKVHFETLLDSSYLLVNYIGHGNETTLMAEELFTVSDLNNWPENKRLPIFVTATCEFGRHDSPLIRSGAEELLIAKKKGAIALLSTGRPVFSNINFALNKAFIESVVEKKEGNYGTLGDIFKQTKNNSLNGPLNRNFSLLGDPSLRLPLPELTVLPEGLVDIVLQTEIDTIKSMQQIRYKGKITDPLTGAGVDSFNGTFEVLIGDKPIIKSTLGDESNAATYLNEQTQIHRGIGTVTDGHLEGEFFVPKNLNDAIGDGTLRIFARDEKTLEEAFGATKILIGGSSPQQPNDTQGPIIQLSSLDKSDSLSTIPFTTIRLLAVLEDPSGINISPLNGTQSISLQINGGEKINLNDYYKAQKGSFTEGILEFPVSGLGEGLNKLTLEVWDNLGNSSSKNIEVLVRGSLAVNIISHIIFPNPASTFSEFQIIHNRQGENLSLQVKIFSLVGSEIFSLSRRFPKAKPLLENISWIFMQSKTKYPAKGTYLYVLELKSEKDGSTDRKSGKIIIR